MKTAVLFFGEIRGNPSQWKRIYDKLVEPNNADVFMVHTIYEPTFMNEYSKEQRELLEVYYKNKGVNYYPSREFFDIFKPKIFKCEPKYTYPLDHYDKFINKVNPINSLTVNNNFNYECTKLAYYAIMNQNETRTTVTQIKDEYEKKLGINYDNVILTRLDINPISTIIFPNKLQNICIKGNSYFFNEQLIAGPSDKMNIFTKLIDQMPNIYEKYANMDHHFMQNEYHIARFLEQNGICVESINIPLGYHIEHSNGLVRFDFSFI